MADTLRYMENVRSPLDALILYFRKISRSIERDAENQRLLTEQGWRVLVIWECQLKKKAAAENLLQLYNGSIN